MTLNKPKKTWAPNIPCARCGDSLPYDEAVKTVEPDWMGFTHATPCKPRVIRRPARIQEDA